MPSTINRKSIKVDRGFMVSALQRDENKSKDPNPTKKATTLCEYTILGRLKGSALMLYRLKHVG